MSNNTTVQVYDQTKGFWATILDFINGIYQFITVSLPAFFDSLWDWCKGFFTAIYDTIISGLIYVWNEICEGFSSLADSTLDNTLYPAIDSAKQLIESNGINISQLQEYFDFANMWIPLDLALIFFGIWVSTFIVVNTVNWVLGLIPTIN